MAPNLLASSASPWGDHTSLWVTSMYRFPTTRQRATHMTYVISLNVMLGSMLSPSNRPGNRLGKTCASPKTTQPGSEELNGNFKLHDCS